ncbi:MAG TPA: sugar phosphate isomerase/epimerase [Solirubrobacterales bacterium]|nr:sugar phosphate isomerase/epimerase [Solirubrobacterales bacterium]
MKATSHRGRGVLALILSALLLAALAFAPGASASEHQKRGIPVNQISIQLWNFAAYIGFGSDPATQARLEETLRRLSEIGYRNVEPFTFNGLTAEEFKALLDKYGLKAPSRHGPTNEATWDQTLADAKVLKQKWVGSGGFAAPGIGSFEDALATAATMNRLGERSVKNGTGRMYGHNHWQEFETTYTDPDTGEEKSAWQIIVENTTPRWVDMQLDVLWSTDGGADPVELLNTYGHRIFSLHVKDGINVADPARATPVPIGEGEIEFEPILRAAKGKVKYYIYEQDPPFGDPTFDPFDSAQKGFDYLSSVRF